jgi:exonuclease SbcD
MRILHLSDLHIGKRLKEYSMLEDQKYILSQILEICDNEKIECVVIAGDVYDKTVPPAEAVLVFDNFIYSVTERKIPVVMISGNHDSAERIAFGGRIMSAGGVYISPVYSGKIEPVVLEDEYGEVNFYLLPFVRPTTVRQYHSDRKIESFTDAMEAVVDNIEIDSTKRNIMVTHQFVTGSQLSQSEEFFIGGTENIDGGIFEKFDYVALGHIHRPQFAGSKKIRYCGSQLKYHFDEVNQEKTYTIADIDEKGNVEITEIPVEPIRQVKAYKGSYEKLTDKSFYSNINTEDYIYITLTDEEDIPDAMNKLRVIYPNLMKLDYDNTRTRSVGHVEAETRIQTLSPLELFSQFYETQNGQPLSAEQEQIAQQLISQIWEENL